MEESSADLRPQFLDEVLGGCCLGTHHHLPMMEKRLRKKMRESAVTKISLASILVLLLSLAPFDAVFVDAGADEHRKCRVDGPTDPGGEEDFRDCHWLPLMPDCRR